VLREYEFTLILKPDLMEDNIKSLQNKYESLFVKDGGQIIKKENWGVRKLAFPVKKAYRGFYAIYDFVGKPEHLAEAERLMRFDESVLRYMSVRLGEDVDVEVRRVEIQKADEKAREAERAEAARAKQQY
jgi:small subunit ribosomal protein S6